MKMLALVLLLSGCSVVDTGHRGIKTHFGQIEGEPLPEGLQWYNIFTESIYDFDVRQQKLTTAESCYTFDTQVVKVDFSAIYSPDPLQVGDIYRHYGSQWADKMVLPVIVSALKDAIGQYKADDLVGKRAEVTVAAQKQIAVELAKVHVAIATLSLTNLDFDKAYETAVEKKVVALQEALTAKNETQKIIEQATQKVKTATADAEAMRIKNEALAKNPALINYELALKWNGQLPQYMFGGGTVPMINLEALKK